MASKDSPIELNVFNSKETDDPNNAKGAKGKKKLKRKPTKEKKNKSVASEDGKVTKVGKKSKKRYKKKKKFKEKNALGWSFENQEDNDGTGSLHGTYLEFCSSGSANNDKESERKGEIQDYDIVEGKLGSCATFAGLKIESIYNGDKIIEGQRVVRGKDLYEKEQDGGVGTVVKINSEEEVEVQWDSKDGTFRYSTGNGKYDLRLYDNAQTGAKHIGFQCGMCDEFPILGMKWRCQNCYNYNLCTKCYMSNEHDPDHSFERKQDNASVEIKVGTRRDINYIAANKEKSLADKAQTANDDKKTKDAEQPKQYFPDHLPALGNNTCGYIKIRDNTRNRKKMVVKCWFLNKNIHVREERPRLLIIFANNTGNDDNDRIKEKRIKEVFKLSKTIKIPFLLLEEKVLVFEDIALVHRETSTEVVKILLDIDGILLNRGDLDGDEEKIMYFKRVAEYCCGGICLPVIISLGKGEMKKKKYVIETAKKERIPIIFFKHESIEVIVTTFQKIESRNNFDSAKQHVFDIRTPWERKSSDTGKKEEKNQIENINELRYLSNLSLDALICYLLIGVSMAESKEKPFGEKNSEIYPNALSMYLLKEGKWKIPKDVIKDFFSYRSIEYIFEKRMEDKFKSGLWQDLALKSNGAYTPPLWREKETADSQNVTGELCIDRISELYGLIFYALLRRNFHNGAKQLIETGGIRIRYILVGCVILKESEKDWRTTQLQKEKMEQFEKMFSHQALRIISCMHENDNPTVKRKSGVNNAEKELGVKIQHAGRLLLNHGCLRDAIKTKNKIFLGNSIVKNILNQIWYGKKTLPPYLCVLFLLLTLLHIILLPFLMLNMEHKPLLWLYRYYRLPVMKVFLNLVGLLALLTGFAYMLLFDFDENGISFSDVFIIAWMASFFLDETKQMLIAHHRKKFRFYIADKWNILDWLAMGTYLCGMFLKVGENPIFVNASRLVLVLAFSMLCIRVLNMFCISELLGPKLVIMQKMFLDTFGFMAIMALITICYNVSYHTILYAENSDFSFEVLEDINWNGYWMLLGEFHSETDRLTEPECTFNKTIYRSGAMARCPSALGRHLAPYLRAVYGFVAVILMMNLLIAMYSYSFSTVQEKSKLYWAHLQTNFLEEYSVKSIFPIHMQIPAFFALIFHLVLWLTFPFSFRSMRKCCQKSETNEYKNKDGTKNENQRKKESKLNHSPMFVRVFLYDTNFDIELRKTREMEGDAALRVKGEMNIPEKDKLTVLQEEMKYMEKSLSEKLEKILEETRKTSDPQQGTTRKQSSFDS